MISTSSLQKNESHFQPSSAIHQGGNAQKCTTQLHLVKKNQADNANKPSAFSDSKNRFIGELYKEHWPKLLRSLRSLVRNEDIAEDIAHDAFLRVSQLEQPQELEFPYAYLYRTATNLIKDRAKAQRIRDDYKQYALLDEEIHVETISPEHQLLAEEKLAIANRAIDALPPKCRRVFLLHRLDNLSHKEIAEQIGISKYAVEKHVMRAMARCKDSL